MKIGVDPKLGMGRAGEGKLPGDTLLHPDTHPCPQIQIQIPNENTNMNNKHKYKIQMPSSNRNVPCARKLSSDRTAPIQQIQIQKQIQNTKSNTNTKGKYTILGKLCGVKGCVLLTTLILTLSSFLLHLGVTLLLDSIVPFWRNFLSI